MITTITLRNVLEVPRILTLEPWGGRYDLTPGDEVATQGSFLIDSQAQLAGTPSLLFPHGALAPAAAHQH